MRELHAKGVNFRSSLRALEKLRGRSAVDATLDALPKAIADALRLGTIVTSGWYPSAWYRELLGAQQRALREGLELTHDVAKAAIQHDFRGIYRLVPLVLSPQALFGLAPKVMNLYWDGGRALVEEVVTGRATGLFEGFVGFDRNVWEDMQGGMRGVMELAGAKDLTMRVLQGGGDGDASMRVVVRWT